MDQLESIQAAVNEADGTPAGVSTTPEATPADSATDGSAAVTGVADEQQTGTDDTTPETTDGEPPVDGQKAAPGPVPYNRFAEVNTQKNEYEGTLRELLTNPEAYREAYRAVHGREPGFGADTTTPATPPPDPGAELLKTIMPVELSEEDFTTESEYKIYQAMSASNKQMADIISGLQAQLQTLTQGSEQREFAARVEAARTEFNSAVGELETSFGVQLTDEERVALAQEAKRYDPSLGISGQVQRAAAFLYFDKAVQRGRDEATRIRQTKQDVTAGRPSTVSGSKGAPAGLSQMDAILKACADAGVEVTQ